MLDTLRKYWGYSDFRPMQREIIESVLAQRDTLGLLPTGGGKSITFQVPAMLLPGLTIVVTPLISLMKDQVDNLLAHGIRAVLFHSGLSPRETQLALTRCRLGKSKIAYLSPERLQNERFMAELRAMTVSLIVVDEAHCISQWGYDFRPSYLKISRLRDLVGRHVPVLALTASATPEVSADIMERLGFAAPNVFARSFRRENLSYVVRHEVVKEAAVLRVLRATRGCSIVYVRSRRRCREMAEMLTREGISASYYHAGLDPEEKNHRQNLWKDDAVRVMVATNAFGMGIDKPDVRVVVHADLPSSLEEYYQEAGRAGRDGREAYAVAVVSPYDKATLSRRLSDSFPDREFIGHVYELLCVFLDVAVGSGYGLVREFDLTQFCSTFRLPPVPTQSALRLLGRSGYIEYVDESSSRSRLMVIMRRDELYDLTFTPEAEKVMQFMLRRYTGLFADYVSISETSIARGTMLSSQQVYDALLYLGRLHAVHYIPRSTLPLIHLTTSREETRHIIIPLEVYERQRERMALRIEAVKSFAFSDTDCRALTLLRYFGEENAAECGKCDVCRSRRGAGDERARSLAESVVYLASRRGATLESILADSAYPRRETLEALRRLADEGKIKLPD